MRMLAMFSSVYCVLIGLPPVVFMPCAGPDRAPARLESVQLVAEGHLPLPDTVMQFLGQDHSLLSYFVSSSGTMFVRPTGDTFMIAMEPIDSIGGGLRVSAVLYPSREIDAQDLLSLPSAMMYWGGCGYLRGRAAGEWHSLGVCCGKRRRILPGGPIAVDAEVDRIWYTCPVWPAASAHPTSAAEAHAASNSALLIQGLDVKADASVFCVRSGSGGALLFGEIYALDVAATGELHFMADTLGPNPRLGLWLASREGVILASYFPENLGFEGAQLRQIEAAGSGLSLLVGPAGRVFLASARERRISECRHIGFDAQGVRQYFFSGDGRTIYAIPYDGRSVLRASIRH